MTTKKIMLAAATAITTLALVSCASDADSAPETTTATPESPESSASDATSSGFINGPGRIADDPMSGNDYSDLEYDAAADVEWQLDNINIGGQLTEDEIIRYARNACWGLDTGETTLHEQMVDLFDPSSSYPNFMMPKATIDVFCPQHSPSGSEFSEMYESVVGGPEWFPGGRG